MSTAPNFSYSPKFEDLLPAVGLDEKWLYFFSWLSVQPGFRRVEDGFTLMRILAGFEVPTWADLHDLICNYDGIADSVINELKQNSITEETFRIFKTAFVDAQMHGYCMIGSRRYTIDLNRLQLAYAEMYKECAHTEPIVVLLARAT